MELSEIKNPLHVLKQLLKCPSITPESAGVVEITCELLSLLGFSSEIIEFTSSPEDQLQSYPVTNILATLGRGKQALAFCGHLDVVAPGPEEAWSSPPFAAEVLEGKIIGRGAEDMKGGIAAFIAAVAKARSDLDLNKYTLVMLLTLDEEKLAVNGVRKLIKYATTNQKLNLEACLIGEPTCQHKLGDCLKVGRRGSLNFAIKIAGTQGHVAYPELYHNPVPEAGRVISALYELNLGAEHSDFERSNLEITIVQSSSDTLNIVPKQVAVKGNVRFNPKYTLAALKDKILQAVCSALSSYGAEGLSSYQKCGPGGASSHGKWVPQDALKEVPERQKEPKNNVWPLNPLTYTFNVPNCRCEVEFLADESEPFISSCHTPLAQALIAAIQDITLVVPTPNTWGGTSDARFIRPYCEVVEFGLLEKTLHQVDEHIKIEDLEKLTNIYAEFLRKYCGLGRGEV